jgi:hypothetical protein
VLDEAGGAFPAEAAKGLAVLSLDVFGKILARDPIERVLEKRLVLV